MAVNFFILFQFFGNFLSPKVNANQFLPLSNSIYFTSENFAGTDCRCRDSLALVKLFEATDGNNWTNKWELESPLENWTGVSLTSGDCVNGITLNNNNLVGSLPIELEEIEFLKSLSLGNNQLSGAIPSEYGNLKNLESLNLRNNQFSGSLSISFSNLCKLSSLNLSVNKLSGEIPIEISNATALSGLFLHQNQFSGNIPSTIGKLTKLVALNLSLNELEEDIPKEIGDLENLTGLGLNENQLTGNIPASLGGLTKLVSLRLEKNQLSGSIPEELGDLKKLESFLLYENNLSGCFPENLNNLCSMGERVGQFSTGYDLTDNPLLPWEGDFSHFCIGVPQTGALCNNGKANTSDDAINNDCTCTQREIIIAPPVEIGLTIQVTGTCLDENNGAIELTINPLADLYKIRLTDEKGEVETVTDNQLFLDNLVNGSYQISIVSTSDSTLKANETIDIPLKNCLDQSKIPQLITPNGDGLNERFIFEELESSPNNFLDNELIIFSRWGNVVYKAQPYQNEWSGHNQTGQLLPDGTYYYVFKLNLNQGIIIKGDISIVR